MATFWDERYARDDFFYGTAPNDFLAAECHRVPKGRVLCLADGEGRNGVHLATLGYDVTSVDASARGLAKARQLASSRGVALETQLADLATFQLGERAWSGIVSIFAHLPPEIRRAVHGQVARALVPGGIFLLEAFTPKHRELGRIGGPAEVDRLMSMAVLRDELTSLEIVLGHEIEREVNEGINHSGASCVVQVIARKPPEG